MSCYVGDVSVEEALWLDCTPENALEESDIPWKRQKNNLR